MEAISPQLSPFSSDRFTAARSETKNENAKNKISDRLNLSASGCQGRTADDRELFYEFSHTLGFSSGVALNCLNNRAADHCTFSVLAHGGELLRGRDPETDGDWKLRKFP
jgi:hypothetical protein